jgi:hypothetical protein
MLLELFCCARSLEGQQPCKDAILVRAREPRVKPTTSDTRIAASFRVSLIVPFS